MDAKRSGKMDESAVFGHVVDELETRDYQPLVHVPGSHQATYADVLDRCETHQITIGGRYPDVLGFTNADRVFAVEVKGSSGLLRGIGPDDLLSKDEFTDMGWPGDIDKVNSGADRIHMIASSLADTGIMETKEAEAFAFHEIAGVSLQRTADETGKSTSEINRALRSGSRKVSRAREFVEILDDCNC